MYILGEQPTKALNLTFRKDQFRRIKLRTSNLGSFGVNELAWWGQYVRDGETGAIVAENSKDTETASGVTTWVFLTSTAEAEIYIYYYEDFYANVPTGTVAYQHDIVFIDTTGRVHVEAAGTFTFLPRYTNDGDTEAQLNTLLSTLTTNFCAALADQRTALLAIPETGTTLASNAGSGTALIAVVDGSIFSAGDDIGIELDTIPVTYFETTVASVDTNDVYLDDSLPSAATSGNGVYKGVCNNALCGT